MIYGSWNIKCNKQKILTFWAIFCPFSLLTTWKIKFLTLKKNTADIIILHICTINDNYMTYGSWDMDPDRQFFCHSGLFFALLTLYGPRESKFSKKWKKHLKILSFYKHKWQSYDVWFLRYGVQWTEFFVILDHFLPLYPPYKKNQNFEK